MSLKHNQQQMIDDIKSEVDFTRHLIGKDHLDFRVMEALRKIPREQFVPAELRNAAFDNGPLPIGYGQTISQPYIVALMTDLLQPRSQHTILEIGSGCGYQTAILSLLCSKVFSMEVVAELALDTKRRLQKMGYSNIETKTGNGYLGWPQHAPYDGIIVTAAAEHIPPALVDQLKSEGRLVIPVGRPYSHQQLMLVQKHRNGNTDRQAILGVVFVPLVQSAPGSADQ